MGIIRRPLARDVLALSNCTQRPFSLSSRQLEDSPSNASSTPDASSTPRLNRQVRSREAFKRLSNLPGTSTSPSGEQTSSSASSNGPRFHFPGRTSTNTPPPGSKLLTRRAPPPGTLARAPPTLRLSRDPGASRPTGVGPNLRGRDGKAPRPAWDQGNSNRPDRPKRTQEKKPVMPKQEEESKEDKVEDDLNNGMVQTLLRLQRKEWDRSTYQPIYSSKEKLDELVDIGNTLFKGEKPEKEKKKTRLDYVLGIQNMHGA
ncbi:hypothetical protein GQ43DRAFT_444417 [Delitschia confertaspora ATCC 74209]|uniref:Uncharacterized protein n=1 Tax=Delitschia confertaspora ATCC 74209 TaxID=1513339 RepID=A0A9P4JDP7_9PLEO|nr:hypothetical protein GQ43DRAFT_444417 [Delitschia confertaspora ATCC 74209]